MVVSYLSEHDDARETCRLVEAEGRRAIAIAGDIGDEGHCRQLIDRTVAELGRLDILVNNAARQNRFESIEEVSTDEWRQTFATNIDAMFYLSRAALPHMESGA